MAQGPEIRVRLTPEGVAEVVAGLRKVQSEAGKGAKKAAGDVGLLTDAVGELKRLLPAIGLAAAGAAIFALGRNALRTADEMGKMAQRVGASSENLSVLTFAAATADVANETLQTGLWRLARSLSGLRKGTQEQVEAFADLGLSAADFAGKDTAQAFDLVAKRLAGMEDGLKKTELAIAIFGRGGAALIPLLNDLGKRGFDAVRADAEKLGLIFSTELTKAAEAANDSMTLIGKQTEGLAVRFVSGLAPAVADSMALIKNATEGSGLDAIKTFGEAVGAMIGGVVKSFLIAGQALGFFFAQIEAKARNLKQLAIDLAKGAAGGAAGGAAAGAAIGSVVPGVGTAAGAGAGAIAGGIAGGVNALLTPTPGAEQQIQNLEDFKRAVEDIIKGTDISKITALQRALRGGSGPGDGADVRAQFDVRQKIAELEKKINADQIKELGAIAKQKADIAAKSAEAERVALQARLAGNQNSIQVARELEAAEVASLARKRAAIEDAYRTEVQLALIKEDALKQAAQRQYRDVLQGINAEAADFAQAKQREQQAIAIIDGIVKRSNQEQLAAAQTRYQALESLRIEFLRRAIDAKEKIVKLDKEIASNAAQTIDFFSKLQASQKTPEEQQALRIDRARTVELELQEAALSGNVEKARELHKQLFEVSKDIATAGSIDIGKNFAERADELFQLAANAEKLRLSAQAQTDTSQAAQIQKQLDEAKKQIDAFQKALTLTVKVDVGQEGLKTLVEEIGAALAKETFKVNVQPVVGALAGGGSVQQLAAGGAVHGFSPTPRSDNIAIMATAGEFMQPVRAVRHYGTDFMEAVRNLDLPRFADGGPIVPGAGAPGAANGGARDVVDVNLNIGGKRHQLFGERERVRQLVSDLETINRAA